MQRCTRCWDIIDDVFDIYANKPFAIPSFEGLAISQEILDKYVGVYSSPEAQVKFTVSRQGARLFIQPGSQNPAPMEALAEDKFKIENAPINLEFDAV